MRVPEFAGATRTTISSVKPIQRVLWLASIRPADLSDATIVHPICWAVSSARANAASACSPTISGETFSVGADRAARVFLAECPGVQSDGTPESYAAQTDDLLSIEGWEIPSDMMDEVRYSSDHLGPDVAAAYARVAGGHAP